MGWLKKMLKTIVCYNCSGIRHKWVNCVCGRFLCMSCARMLNNLCKECLQKNVITNYYNHAPEGIKCQ